MQSPKQILADLWTSVGGEPAALDTVTLTGEEPPLPSSFGLAAGEIAQMRSRQAQDVAVDMRHAVVECRSERYLRVEGQSPPPTWDAIAGVYRTGDARFVRLH